MNAPLQPVALTAATGATPKHSCAQDPPRYRLFFLSALGIMLVAGVGWGTSLLVQFARHGQYTGFSIFELNAHGHAMLSGFVQFFIIGFSYQAFPKVFRHPLALPHLCKAVYAALVFGLASTMAGLLLHGSPTAPWIAALGQTAEAIALVAWLAQIVLTFRRGGTPTEPHVGFIVIAGLFMIAQSILAGRLHWMTLTAASRMEVIYYVAAYQPPLRNLQLHGVMLLMILGVAHRMMTHFYVFPRTSNRWMYVALALLASSVVAEATLFALMRETENPLFGRLLVLPWTGLIAGTLIVVARWRLWRRPVDTLGRTDRMAPFVQSSFAWLGVAFAMMVALPLWSQYTGTYFSHAFYGASRHAFVFGFATMMIVAFTLRIVPNLSGIVPTGLPSMRMTLWLLNVGCAAHIAFQVAGDVRPGFLLALPSAGLLELVGVVSWASHLVGCIWSGHQLKRRAERQTAVASLRVLG